jgi:hypothetical protein
MKLSLLWLRRLFILHKIVQVNKYELFRKVKIAGIRKRIKEHKYQFIYRRKINQQGGLLAFVIINHRGDSIAEVWVKQLG